MVIDGREIGNGNPVFIIAEIGINHNGDMQIAKRLIDAAFATGWDCVKFQKRNPDLCVPETQKNLPKDTPWGKMTYLEYKNKLEFSYSDYCDIHDYCGRKPILWTASVWDIESLDFICEFNPPFIKIGSAKLTDELLLKECTYMGIPIILSTGMSTIEEIDRAVSIINKGKFTLMHTCSAYPADVKDLNLYCIPYLKERYKCPVGYSGHEFGLEPTVVAVALGADIIERHITIDHTLWGTDQAASLEIHAMDLLIKRIRDVRLSLGDGVKRVTESEKPIKEKLRK